MDNDLSAILKAWYDGLDDDVEPIAYEDSFQKQMLNEMKEFVRKEVRKADVKSNFALFLSLVATICAVISLLLQLRIL